MTRSHTWTRGARRQGIPTGSLPRYRPALPVGEGESPLLRGRIQVRCPLEGSPTMQPQSLSTRSVSFAFLFGPPRTVARDEAAGLYDAVCRELHIEDFVFRYSTSEPDMSERSRGFSITLERKEGRGGFKVAVDQSRADNPLRLLMEFAWPPSLVHVQERFDLAAEAVFRALRGPWQRVMAETRTRAQCYAAANDASSYLQKSLLRLSPDRIAVLGPTPKFVSVGLHTAPETQTTDPLESPAHRVTMEVLREDPRAIYLELISTWSQVPLGTAGAVSLEKVRPISASPSEYVEYADRILRGWVETLSRSQEGGV